MLKIRYQTPSGALATTEIKKPETELEGWKLRIYISRELQKKNIEFKKKPKIIL